MRRIILLFLAAAPAFSQPLLFGVKGGVPATDLFKTGSNGLTSYFSATRRYTIGPTVELHLPFRLGIEFGALYKRLDYDSRANLVDAFSTGATTGNSWEFPLLVKYRLTPGPLQPYVVAGPSFNHLSGLTQFTRTTFFGASRTSSNSGTPIELENDFREGVTVGAGLQVGRRFLRLSPEIRYTRWGRDSFRDICCSGGLLHSNPNQAEFLLGITF